MAELSPMMQQYFQVKKEYPDSILFFRLGDFYEMFFDDAKIASSVLELTLTSRACGQAEKAPMCGVPFHSADSYITKLVTAGYKVAICEQVEDPATAKGVVKRDVLRIITKGSIIENSMLDESKNNYLTTLYLGDSGAGICFIDLSTGLVNVTFIKSSKRIESDIINELGVFSPSEIILNQKSVSLQRMTDFISKKFEASCEVFDEDKFGFEDNLEECVNHFGEEYVYGLKLNETKEAAVALGTSLKYLKSLQKNDLSNIKEVNFYSDNQFMKLSYTTQKDLELVESNREKEKKGSLLWVLDKTRTSMGKRLLRSWIEKPLLNYGQISRRHCAISALCMNNIALSELSEKLRYIGDMERLMTKIIYETANARDLNALKETISHLPSIKEILSEFDSELLRTQNNSLDTLKDVYELISSCLKDEDLPFSIREGGMIKDGFNEELDSLRKLQKNSNEYIKEIEQREKQTTGIAKLKIGYNRVFGYYIEVINSFKDFVPEHYIRKQTLSGCERYITEELKELESKILSANERISRLEGEIFSQLRNAVADEYNRIRRTSGAVSVVDVICSFAKVAFENDYVCPEMNDSGIIKIKDGRHPVVEKVLGDLPFVSNDTFMDQKENICSIITGPNMAGKSTYMRQVALICLMAQIGSFVPAKSAELPILSGIFTRVGASDDLSAGQSTFMVEMNEVSEIISNADKNSLIILDEVGRGTSTFDGMSIARAVLEHIVKKIGAKTLFSTHYHELTVLENELKGVKNYNICVKKRGDEITFLRRIVPGEADGSYGVEVAKLAGISDSIINRARAILKELESGEVKYSPKEKQEPKESFEFTSQISFEDEKNKEIIEEIKNIDVNTMTPIEALTKLHSIVAKVKT